MSARNWIFGIALGLICSDPSWGQENTSEPQPQPDATQEQPADDAGVEPPEILEAIPAVNVGDHSQLDNEGSTNIGEQAQRWPDVFKGDGWAQWIMAATSILAFVISAVAVFLLYRTLWFTREAVNATKEANDAAQAAVEVTRELGQAQVRAYLRCAKVTCKPLGQNDTDDVFCLNVEIENLGQSPASELQFIIGIEVLRFDGSRIGKPYQMNAPADPSMAPRGAATLMLSFVYPKGTADEVRASKAYLRFTIAYVYHDVFGKRSEFITYHHTDGSLLDSGITASHIVGMKPEHEPKQQ